MVDHGRDNAVGDSAPGGRRIGVLGGTFDPPHLGHLAVALDVHHGLGLDRTLLVVANDPWQKSAHREVSEAAVRLRMVDALVAGFDGLESSDAEIRRGGETYTADTLEDLASQLPGASFFLVVGSDAAAGLDTWKRSDDVRELATTVVVDRGGRAGGRPPEGWPHVVVDVPSLEISSSDLRSRFGDGRPVEAMMTSSVIDIVRSVGLYGSAW